MPNKFAKGVPCLSVKDCPAERHMAIEDLEGHELHFSSRIGAAG